MRELGAEPMLRSESAGSVDAVLDLVGGEPAAKAWPQVVRGGAFASTVAPPSAEEATARAVRPVAIYTQTNRDQIMKLAELVENTLRSIVSRTLPLASARQAHEMLQAGGVTGKLVLEIE